MSKNGISDDLRQFLPTDAHLADLVELRAIANGTETEAYTWPRLMARLNEMIRRRQTVLLGLAERDAAWAASVGAPTPEE